MNKTLLCACIVTILLSCTNPNETITEPKGAGKTSFVNLDKSDYQGQLQYLDGHFDTFNLSIKNNFKDKINNDKYDWRYFDSLYNENLNISEKQYLAFIVLAKKDLLGDYKNLPSDEKSSVILKYTSVLVKTEYIGYCLLYNSISLLNDSKFLGNKKIIDNFAADIVDYSKRTTFFENAIKAMANTESNKYLIKIKENQKYLGKIENFISQ